MSIYKDLLYLYYNNLQKNKYTQTSIGSITLQTNEYILKNEYYVNNIHIVLTYMVSIMYVYVFVFVYVLC